MIRVYLLGFLSRRGLLALAGLALLSAAVLFAGPFLTIFGWRPFLTEAARSGTVAGLVVLFFAGTLLRLFLARRANARMIKSLLEVEGRAVTTEAAQPDEAAVLRSRFEEAIALLRERMFPGRRGDAALFELPWYAVLGAPGAGKTAFLRHSGLEFPLGSRFGAEAGAGDGATRQCEWWFADQAVMIDTPGRYLSHEQNTADVTAWRTFLGLLKTYRSRRPLNGAVLVVSLWDILHAQEPARSRQIAALRARLSDLSRTAGEGLPVYLVIAKCDLIVGFNEYFEGLDEAEREQVWGLTFPLEDHGSQSLTGQFERHFQFLAERIEAGLRERAHEERDLSRRGRIFLFPKEFAGLRRELSGFLQEVFRSSRFDTVSRLRGVYFTSAVQDGTPVDRTAAAFGRDFGLTAPPRQPPAGPGRPFFITRILTSVAFPEQGLAGVDRRVERKLILVQNAGYAAAASLVLGFGVLWWAAMARSETRLAATSEALHQFEARLGALPDQGDLAALLPALDAAEAVRTESGRGGLLAALDGLGLSATLSLVPAADSLRQHLLLGRLFPAFAERQGERISSLLQRGGDGDAIRSLLRSYLMLGEPERFDAAVIRATARDEARVSFPVDQSQATRLDGHLGEMIALLPRPARLDQGLVDAARARLMRTPRSEQIYARLLREAARNPRLHAVDLAGIAGPGALRFAAGPGLQAPSLIPKPFTRDAFYDFVLPRLPVLIREEMGIDWVTAGGDGGEGLVQTGTRDVMDRYVADYIRTWQTALQSVRLASTSDRQQALATVQSLAGPESPLERLIGVLRTNTELPLPGEQAKTAVPGPMGMIAGGLMAEAASSTANAAAMTALGEGPWPGTTIATPFRPLTELVAPPAGGSQPAMARIRELFSGAYGTLSAVSTAPDPHEAAFKVATQSGSSGTDPILMLRTDSALRPEPVRGILRATAAMGMGAVIGDAIAHVNEVWRRDVLPQCQAALDQRYPLFVDGQDEVSLRDFSDMFRPGGILDDFFKKNLAPFVVEQRNGFVPIRLDGAPIALRSDALAQFYRARAIRNAFFGGTGAAPSLKFSVKPVFLDPKLLRATLALDGRDIVYRHEATRAYDIEWPTRTEASTVSVTLTDLTGRETRIERDGAWALLRLVDSTGLSASSGWDVFGIRVKAENDASVVYRLKAASVNNAFNLGALRAFRCPDTL